MHDGANMQSYQAMHVSAHADFNIFSLLVKIAGRQYKWQFKQMAQNVFQRFFFFCF